MRRKFEFALNNFLIDLNRLIGIEWWETLGKNLVMTKQAMKCELSYCCHFID